MHVKSHMAAVEASIDIDYLRFRGSFFWAQGDKNPTDEKGKWLRRDSSTTRILWVVSFLSGTATAFA